MKENFIKKSSTLMILLFTVTGCFNNGGPALIEGKDYIDHAVAHDGKKFVYDETMWYINELDKLPLPDPHIYVEDGKYLHCTEATDMEIIRLDDYYLHRIRGVFSVSSR